MYHRRKIRDEGRELAEDVADSYGRISYVKRARFGALPSLPTPPRSATWAADCPVSESRIRIIRAAASQSPTYRI